MRYEIVYKHEDIVTGMKKYINPPSHGMLFILNGRYSIVTMEGMKYPLIVSLYDRNRILISRSILYPEDKITISSDIYYMVEIPYQ